MATLLAATNNRKQRHTVCGIRINTLLARTGGVGLVGKAIDIASKMVML